MAIETQFDIPFIASLALREKQIQQNYRPIIAVHKWFARRPGTLFRGLLLSEFCDEPLRQAYYKPHDMAHVKVADPFMGGGTPLIEANRMGCDVAGFDINPMAYWVVREEIEHLDLKAYTGAATSLVDTLRRQIGHLYQTRCTQCGADDAQVKYFLWVKQQTCTRCQNDFDVFPGYLLAKDSRHPKHVLVCHSCGELNEVGDPKVPGQCRSCRAALRLDGSAHASTCECPNCDQPNKYPAPDAGAPRHRMFAIEYHCTHCKPTHKGRFFKRPDATDVSRYEECEADLQRMRPRYIPEATIEPGQETNRLLRWGYRRFREMFNSRQLRGLELSGRLIHKVKDTRVRRALATNFSDLLRYQNMVCRYDTMALKSLDIFSIHGFPVGLIQCESNLLGIRNAGGTSVGSGGWDNITAKFYKAKAYCDAPFEVRAEGKRRVQVPITGEWIGESRKGCRKRNIRIECDDATEVALKPASLDAVLTDPPYFGNVQYAELMEFCYVWLRKLIGDDDPMLKRHTVREQAELTGNAVMDRNLAHFADGLSRVFQRMAKALKPGAPLAFTYHHNKLDAYYAVALAILDAGFACTKALPCPAEMGGSIHISGTQSSIIDTVFVCREATSANLDTIPVTVDELAGEIHHDLSDILAGGHRPTAGDINCIVNGHLTQLAIASLAPSWTKALPVTERLSKIEAAYGRGLDSAMVKSAIEALGPLGGRGERGLFDAIEASLTQRG
ncbi:MAG: hypothetical protein WD468_03310 [Pirellulales bacterium]